jgi:hypothetical protein
MTSLMDYQTAVSFTAKNHVVQPLATAKNICAGEKCYECARRLTTYFCYLIYRYSAYSTLFCTMSSFTLHEEVEKSTSFINR